MDEVQLFPWCCGRVALACSSHGIVFVCLVVVSVCLFCGVSTLCSGRGVRGVSCSSCSTLLHENKGNKQWNITGCQLLCPFCSNVPFQTKQNHSCATDYSLLVV